MQYHQWVDEYDGWCALSASRPAPEAAPSCFMDSKGTIHNLGKKQKKEQRIGWREWYTTLLPALLPRNAEEEAGRSEFNLGITEYCWRAVGRPYYNIHPRMLPILGGLSLPDIPAKLVRFVHCPYVVQFPVNEPSLFLDDGVHCLKSAICMIPEYLSEAEDAFRPEKYQKVGEQSGHKLIVWLDFGETLQGLRVKCYKQLSWRGDDTLQQAYDALPGDPDFDVGLKIPSEIVQQAVKMVLGVGFIAADPDNGLVRPHLLNADMPALATASPERILSLHQKAAKKWGRLGYVIGDALELPSIPNPTPGHRLKWQHIVGMHWKVVHYGPNHSLSRPQLILPYRRGKDRPFRV